MYSKSTFFILFFLVAQQLLTAQCTLTSTGQDFCTECASLIDANGVISGTLTLDLPNNSSATIPASCGGVALSLGALTVNIPTKNNLTIDPAVGIDASATGFTLVGGGNATIVVDGTTYNANGNQAAATSFTTLQNNIRAEATSLPVTLSSWNASPTSNGILVEWVSSSELDNDFYEVEYSNDGIQFSSIAAVSGQITSSTEVAYDYLHEKPAGSLHYYRLSQQDIDGTRTNLGVRVVRSSFTGGFSISPNPILSGNVLTVQMPQENAPSLALLYSSTGKMVASYPLTEGNRSLQLPAGLASGIYLVRMGEHTTRLLVK